jgi:CRISPR-associated endonuclease/helicase Cas3
VTSTSHGYKRLLAKSSAAPDHPKGQETLRGHTAMVIAAAERILAHRGLASLRAARLPDTWEDRLHAIVWLAAFCHDLGKCSDHFQAMVRGARKEPQAARHEALSLWLAWPGRPLADWLRHAVQSDTDYLIAIVAGAGHHRKFPSHAVAPADAGAGTRVTLLAGHASFARTLRLAKCLGEPPVLTDLTVENTRRSTMREQLERWEEEAGATLRDAETRTLLAVVKALVLAADVAGSALPRGGEKPRWIDEQLEIGTDYVGRADRARIVETRLAGKGLRPFQIEVGESHAPITFVRAGCGSGKTLAACHWAAQQHPTRQLWLTYPTTGTATEGFRGYLDKIDIPARLEHGRAEVDVDIFSLRDHTDESRERDRLDALRNWGCDVITCTVDTVLGLVQNQRRGLYAWPGLSHSAVVFDEIHAYDDQLFGSLLRFLRALPGIPALLMTASLPDERRQALEDLCVSVHKMPLAVIEGPGDLEALPRYRIEPRHDVRAEVEQCLAAGGKVLWVSNTVDRAMDVAASVPAGVSPFVYHSRFKYIHRVDRHGDVIKAFDTPGPVLAATTQVAEMSLDLSADLLVTDIAPIPAMIQRMGRLNRRSTPESPAPPKPCLVLDVPFPEPYTNDQLVEARRWVESLAGREISQRDLVDAWAQGSLAGQAATAATWLDGGFRTEPAAVRDAQLSLTVLLKADAEDVAARRRRSVEVALPMGLPPRKLDWQRWRKVDFLPVAPDGAITYDPIRGARWNK